MSRSVTTVIWVLILLEAAKCLFVATMLRRAFTRHIDRALLKEQLTFIVPLGTAVTLSLIHYQLANLIISIKMGVERLAIYYTAGQQIPIVNIVQSSATDVLFPEMAQIGNAERLTLWRRANIVFCFISFPVYAIFFYFAPVYIETLFRSQYLPAVPYFRIYLGLMLLQCFDVGSPLRAINQNKYFILGNTLSLVVNVGLVALLFSSWGLAIPALSYVFGTLVGNTYCATRVMHFYEIGVRQLFYWKKIARIIACVVVALPVLVASRWVDIHPVVKAVSFSLLYLAAYYLALRRFRIAEIDILVAKVTSKLRRR